MPNRRSVLIGLGGLVAGGGALIGTGAFDTVEAERTVTVNTAGDAGALLALQSASDSGVVDTVDDLLEIDFGAAADDGQGVNLNAVTTVGDVDLGSDTVTAPALTIQNNGSQSVNVSFDIDFDDSHGGLTSGNEADVLKLWTDADGTEGVFGADTFGNLVADDLEGLGAGETVNIALQVDTRGLDTNDVDTSEPLFEPDATITATSE